MAYTKKGRYVPKNYGKYRGDRTDITYRSSWELRVCKFLDTQPNVLWWSSEEVKVPYRDPSSKGRMRRYHPDFVACVRTREGDRTYMIEVKPYGQTNKPQPKGNRRTKRYLREHATYATNTAKWDAARRYCDTKGWEFVVWTERELFGDKVD